MVSLPVGLLFLVGLGGGIVINSLADNLPPDAANQRHPPRLPQCRQCGQAYAPRYWLALAHSLLGRGRCPHCAAPRPLRHGVVEIVTGLSLAWAWLWAGGEMGRFLPAACIVLAFILFVVIDIEHRLILWITVWPSALLFAVLGGLDPGRGWQKTLLGGLAGYVIVFGVYLLGQGYAWLVKRRRGEALEEVVFGGGDVNLAGVVGLVVGWSGILLALLIAVLSSGAFSLGYVIVQSIRRRYDPYAPIPYGPFILLGGFLLYFFSAQIRAAAGGP
jgi:prepilin signal peptidase PulO-like enzyme (type II secretory pathway)